MSSPQNAIIGNGTAIGILKDGDSGGGGDMPKLFISDASADEGVALVFTVTQQVKSVFDSEATWTIRLPKTAIKIGELSLDDLDTANFRSIQIDSDGDYAILTGTVSIPAGQKNAQITFRLKRMICTKVTNGLKLFWVVHKTPLSAMGWQLVH